MPDAPGLDSATWAALAITLAVIGGALTVLAWRRRGIAAGVRGAAWTLVPLALWLTGTLRLLVTIVEDVVGWAARLVFSPVTWLGIVLAGLAAALFVLSGVLRARGAGTRKQLPGDSAGRRRAAASPEASPAATGQDPEMAEIEAILRKHGI